MRTADRDAAQADAFGAGGGRSALLGPLAALFAAFAILVVGNGLHSTLLALRAQGLGASETGVGAMMSAFYAGYAAAGLAGARLVARVGAVRSFAGLCSVVSAIALAHVLMPDLGAWIALRALHGACFAILVLVVEAWINAETPRDRRGRVLSLYGLTFLAGGMISQQLLNLADPAGFALFAAVSILASLALVPVTLSGVAEPQGLAADRLPLGTLWRASPLGVAGVAASGLLVASFWGLGPAFARAAGLADGALSLFMSALVGGAILTQWPLGWLSDRVDRRLVTIGTFAAAAVAAAALTVAQGAPVLIALAALYGAAVQPAYSLCVAHVNDRAPEGPAAIAGGLILLFGVAAAAGPLVAGLAMDALGPGGLFLVSGAVAAAVAAFGLLRLGRRDAVAQADKRGYAEAPRTTHAIARSDPRREGAGA